MAWSVCIRLTLLLYTSGSWPWFHLSITWEAFRRTWRSGCHKAKLIKLSGDGAQALTFIKAAPGILRCWWGWEPLLYTFFAGEFVANIASITLYMLVTHKLQTLAWTFSWASSLHIQLPAGIYLPETSHSAWPCWTPLFPTRSSRVSISMKATTLHLVA